MIPEDLRNAALAIDADRHLDGRVDAASADTLAAAVLALTDPTPVDAAWLNSRWPSAWSGVYWLIWPEAHIEVMTWRGDLLLRAHLAIVSKNPTRGDVVRLLWGLGVAVPQPKGGE